MRGKRAGLYKGNGGEDKGTLHSKRLATREMTRTPTKFNDPRLACQSVHISQETSLTVTPRVRPSEVKDPWSEGATEEYKIRDDKSI